MRHRRLRAACALGGAVLFAQVVSAQFGGPGFVAYPQRPVTDPAAVERGKGQFSVNCGFCHGPDARGGDGGGPNLMRSDTVLLDEKGEKIGPVIMNGRADKGMPSFMGMIDDETLQALAKFVKEDLRLKK